MNKLIITLQERDLVFKDVEILYDTFSINSKVLIFNHKTDEGVFSCRFSKDKIVGVRANFIPNSCCKEHKRETS